MNLMRTHKGRQHLCTNPVYSSVCFRQIKECGKHIMVMTNLLDETLDALWRIQNIVDTVKTRKTITTEKQVLQDYDRIISYLENAGSDLINAVVLFQKHEGPL